MLYLSSTMISKVDLAHYLVSRAKDRVSVDSGTITHSKSMGKLFGHKGGVTLK